MREIILETCVETHTNHPHAHQPPAEPTMCFSCLYPRFWFRLHSVTFGYVRLQEFLLRSAKMVGAHYPERSYKIFILNAPWWFSVVWKVRCVGMLSIYGLCVVALRCCG